MRSLMVLLICAAAARSQTPIVFPGGVVSAASYTTGGLTGRGIGPGSIASIFGANLAAATVEPDTLFPLPTQLGDVSVIVGGTWAPLFYVSPGQINFQVPINASGQTTVVVSTARGNSNPYQITTLDAFGVFTQGAGGCGQAAALNAANDGTLSFNSPSNSASPGEALAIFGTGLFPVFPAPPDGLPSPSSPLGIYAGAMGGTVFDLNGPLSPHAWLGLAPGLVAVDQVNFQVPIGTREGCAVPLFMWTGASGNSKPVTVSIRKGGGQCVDPPAAGYGEITWAKTIATGTGADGETDVVTVSLQASPGRQSPPARHFREGVSGANLIQNFGPSCLLPGYRSLDAGTVSVRGPGFGPMDAALTPLGAPESGQVAGLTEYRASLPSGTIHPGSFNVSARGGLDLDAFQFNVQVGSGINVTTPFPPGTVLQRQAPIVVKWTGGDIDAWVTMKLVTHFGAYDKYSFVQARASDGEITMPPDEFADMPVGTVEMYLEVDPEDVSSFSVPGLSLGGLHTWRYLYRFGGLALY